MHLTNKKENKMAKGITMLLFLFTFVININSQNTMIDKTVVNELDIEKYLGTWYEIARYDHSFERGLVGVTADYSFREDGKIKVINSGFKGSLKGPKSTAIGKAKIPNPKIPSKLKVSFFWIFYADYFVLELDSDYKWAVIGSKSDKYLWILSRSPLMDKEVYNELLNRLTKRGYDVKKLLLVEQKMD
ncbi:MAG: lipocalin family protein [Bacteroidales bacterium]|nr:lipocalin family protein [Bacteroidales bacterium]